MRLKTPEEIKRDKKREERQKTISIVCSLISLTISVIALLWTLSRML